MPKTLRPLERIQHIVAYLKGNPQGATCTQILRFLEKHFEITCCEKTIWRDIKYLKEEHRAPIEYEETAKGYRITRAWDFNVPFCEPDHLLGAFLSTRIAEPFLPTAAAQAAHAATDYLIAGNGEESLERLRSSTLLTDAGQKCSIPDKVWRPVTEAWAQRRVLTIQYVDNTGKASRRECEPHYLALRKNRWYIHCHDLLRNELRSFSLQRIKSAAVTAKSFSEREELLGQIRAATRAWEWMVPNVKIRGRGDTGEYIRTHFPDALPEKGGKGVIVVLPGVRQYHLINWVFRSRGEVAVLEPTWLADEIRGICRSVLKSHR